MRIPIYPKMFLFNTKPISHFCLLALGIAVQGNGFLSNTSWSQLEILGTWVRIKGRWGSKESGLPGATTTRVPAPKFNFPQPSVVTLWRTPLQNGFPRRRQRLNEDKRLTETILLQNEGTAWYEIQAFSPPSLLIFLIARHQGWCCQELHFLGCRAREWHCWG